VRDRGGIEKGRALQEEKRQSCKPGWGKSILKGEKNSLPCVRGKKKCHPARTGGDGLAGL